MDWTVSRFSSEQSLSREQGIYIPMFAITLFGLIAAAALAIDAGNLYWRKTQLQSVSDLAAAGGLGYRALHGWAYFKGYDHSVPTPGLNETNKTALRQVNSCDGVCPARVNELRARAQEIVRANLLVRGLDPSRSNIDNLDQLVTFNIQTDEIVITLNYDVPLYLMSYFSFLDACSDEHECRLQARTSARIRSANIVLALDQSGSMNCPIEEEETNLAKPCGCRIDKDYPNCSSPSMTDEDRKMYALRDATFNFMSFFNPNKDRVSIVPFHTVANVAFSIHDSSNNLRTYGPKWADLENAITAMKPAGNTNHCDALWTGYNDLLAAKMPNGATVPGNEPFFMLLFTDGAPTAGRFAFVDGNKDGTELKKVMTEKNLTNDWLQYVVEWKDGLPDPTRWSGPSPLVHRSAVSDNFPGGVPAAGIAMCGNYVEGNSPPMESDVTNYHTTFYNEGFADRKCLQNFEFYPTALGNGMYTAPVSKDGGTSQLDEALDFTNQDPNFSSPYWYIQKYYDCAIEAADFIRRQGGMVFTIGLGPAAYQGVTGDPSKANLDPYQNPLEDFTRKEYFLRRLAYDSYHAGINGDPSFKKPATTFKVTDPNDKRKDNHVWAGYSEYKGYGEEAVGDRAGAYSGTNNPKELDALFTRVAKDILLQLVQ